MKSHFLNPTNFLLLIVDDIPANLKVLHRILEPMGYQMTFANSEKKALERMTQIHPDLILVDLMMPEIDGLEVAGILSQNLAYQDIPIIIFLTASQETEHLTEAFAKGAVDYITKPLHQGELLACLKPHLYLKYCLDLLVQQIHQEKRINQITRSILSYTSFDITELIACVDQCLYFAKQRGQNQWQTKQK